MIWQATNAGFIAGLCQGTPRPDVLGGILAWARRTRLPVRGVLIEDLRGGFDAARSDWLDRLSGLLEAPVVLLSDSALTRGAAACHLLGERVLGFRRRDVEAALNSFDATPEERTTLQAALWALKVARSLEGGLVERRRRRHGIRSSHHSAESRP